MLKKKWKDGYKLVGLKTDAIYLGIPEGEMFADACKHEPIIKYMNHSDVPDVHPLHYDDVARQMSEWHYEDWFIYDEPETPPETLELIKKYPYKLEYGKKPPKYDEARLKQLRSTIGVVREDLLCKPIEEREEKNWSQKWIVCLKYYMKCLI